MGAKVDVKKPAVKTPTVRGKVDVKGKAAVKAPAVKGKVTIKVNLKQQKVKVTPKTFGTGKAWRKSFVTAWNTFNAFAKKRGSFARYGKGCFQALAKLKIGMACAACDNKMGATLTKGIALNKAS